MPVKRKKRIAILGSTGTIGVNTLKVIRAMKGAFELVGLSANSNVGLLAKQIRAHHPKIAAVKSAESAETLRRLVRGRPIKIISGEEGAESIVRREDVDIVMLAISGIACLKPLLAAIDSKKKIALANKEALVSAGEIVMKRARKNGSIIIPVDSEHSAIYQCIQGASAGRFMKKIFLTSSGGPLMNVSEKRFDSIPRERIINHPKWKMGKKISVDSATLMNKGLEIIEARWLFDIDQKSIEVLVHPEAIVHAMVELIDGSVIAQLGMPDMRLPIQYALTYPERVDSKVARADFTELGTLSFMKPETKRFPCLELAREALKRGGTYPAALSAADEEVVRYFLEGRILFSKIPKIIERVLARHRSRQGVMSVARVLETDRWARMEVRKLCQ
ncbi:MAG: 1-deoxy-D-xylulose-5-phosphate reductoisomerase [Candidatus Omnitrophota bacterium]